MTDTNNTASPSGPSWSGPGWNGRHSCRGRWRPLELLAMILGFMVFWPIGLAVIAFKIWQKKTGYGGDLVSFTEERAQAAKEACRAWRNGDMTRGLGGFAGRGGFGGGFGPRPTGNSAFDEWRANELSRLEEERRRLEAAEREFADHIDQLRRARDREEFEQFMRARNSRGPDTGASAPPAP